MRPNIQLLKLLTLLCILLHIAIRLSNLLMQPTHYFCTTGNKYALQDFTLRITICSIALIYYLHLHKKQGTKSLMKPSTNFQRLAICTILAQFMMTFALILGNSIKETLWHTSLQPVVYFSSIADFLFHGVLQTTCLAAIVEELLFRGILQKLLGQITQIRLLTTVISALAFSLMHCNMTNSLLYFTMGCFLSYLYQQAGHIIYPMIAHAVYNLFVTSMIYFRLDETFKFAVNRLPIITRSILTLGCLLTVYFCVTYMIPGKNKKKQFLN